MFITGQGLSFSSGSTLIRVSAIQFEHKDTRNEAPRIIILCDKPSQPFPSQNSVPFGGWIPADTEPWRKERGSRGGYEANPAPWKGRKGWGSGLNLKNDWAVSPCLPIRWRRSHNCLGGYNLHGFEVTILSCLFNSPQCSGILLSAIYYWLTHVGGNCGHHQPHLIPSGTGELGKFCPGKSLFEQSSEHSRLQLGWRSTQGGGARVCLCEHGHTSARAALALREIFQKLAAAAAAAALGKLKSWNLWINPSTKLSVSNSVPVFNTLQRVNLCRTSHSWHFWYSVLGGCSNSRCLNHWFFRRSHTINDIQSAPVNTQELFNVHIQNTP